MIPNAAPVRIDLMVNSAICVSGDTNGLKLVGCSAIAVEFCKGKIRKKQRVVNPLLSDSLCKNFYWLVVQCSQQLSVHSFFFHNLIKPLQ